MIRKSIKFFLCGFFLILFTCDIKAQTKSKIQRKTIFLPGYKIVHTLKNERDIELGKVYIVEIKKGIFRHLRILSQKGGADTLYYIDNLKLRNNKGIDIEVGKGEFYGYKITFANKSNIVLNVVNNKGIGISDDIIIAWNNESKLFQVLKTP